MASVIAPIGGMNVSDGSPNWVQVRARVISNDPVAAMIFYLRLDAPEVARRARPGQFIGVKVSPGIAPLLRRPFSLCTFDPTTGAVGILYRTVGQGTRLLSQCGPGDELDLIGPLGRGFPVGAGSGAAVLVGGGIGVAPLPALARALVAAGREVIALVGARTSQELAGVPMLSEAGARVEVCTDDGTAGRRGPVTDLLQEVLAAGDAGEVHACGPGPMLGAVQTLCRRYRVPGYLSLEERMACGVGACLGCACRAKSPVASPGSLDGSRTSEGARQRTASERVAFKKVCLDGPVFPAEEVYLG